MLHAPLVMLALGAGDCDARATLAGELMILHQTGAPLQTVEAAAQASPMPDFAASLVERVLAAETSADGAARELAAYHFAAEVHAECHVAIASA